MRLATIATAAGPRAARFENGAYIELSTSVREILAGGPEAMKRAASATGPRVENPKLLPPIPNPAKIWCIGLNYRDHAAETGAAVPREPVLFSKFASALVGYGDDIVLPPVSSKVDYEAELVLVIGTGGKSIPRDKAMSHLAGCMVGHDVSARDWQVEKDGKQWLAGKTFDTFAPTGPHLVTMDEVGDPHELGIRLRLNGETMQDSSTKQLIFRADELIAYVSQVTTLEPGDLIFTGTPPGVGIARKPPVWLKGGDVVEVEIDRLGTLRNTARQG